MEFLITLGTRWEFLSIRHDHTLLYVLPVGQDQFPSRRLQGFWFFIPFPRNLQTPRGGHTPTPIPSDICIHISYISCCRQYPIPIISSLEIICLEIPSFVKSHIFQHFVTSKSTYTQQAEELHSQAGHVNQIETYKFPSVLVHVSVSSRKLLIRHPKLRIDPGEITLGSCISPSLIYW